MIYVRINDVLKQKTKTKYWFIKNMEGSYQSLSNLMNNETAGIKFDTLDKICKILDCEPGEILIRKKFIKRRKNPNEQIDKAI